MASESYASIYGKAVREARAAERARDESRRAAQKRKDQAEKYAYSKDPPQGHRVYRKGAMWVAETPAWGRPIDEVWGDVFYTRPAAVNAAWRHFEGEKQLPPQRRGGKGRGPYNLGIAGTLTVAEVRAAAKMLRRHGFKLPRLGYTMKMSDEAPARELAHDRNGYYWVGWKAPGEPGRGGKGRKARGGTKANVITLQRTGTDPWFIWRVENALLRITIQRVNFSDLGYAWEITAPEGRVSHGTTSFSVALENINNVLERNGYRWRVAAKSLAAGGKARKARGGKGRGGKQKQRRAGGEQLEVSPRIFRRKTTEWWRHQRAAAHTMMRRMPRDQRAALIAAAEQLKESFKK